MSSDLKKVIDFLQDDNKTHCLIVVSEEYSETITFTKGSSTITVFGDGKEFEEEIYENAFACELYMLAQFAIISRVDLDENNIKMLVIAASDIFRNGDWPEGNLLQVGGASALAEVRAWEHYPKLENYFSPLVELKKAQNQVRVAQDEAIKAAIDLMLQIK